MLGFSCGSFGPSFKCNMLFYSASTSDDGLFLGNSYSLVVCGPCSVLGFSCGSFGPSFKCNLLFYFAYMCDVGIFFGNSY